MPQHMLIDSRTFASDGASRKGELPVAELTRLLDLLTDSGGQVAYRINGRIGDGSGSQLLVEVDGELSLRCQRCLETIDYPLAVRSLLEFVDSDGDLTQEELEDDSRDFLPHQKALDVALLIEDEILLALPPAPRHDDCVLPGAGQESEIVSPFTMLAGLHGKVQ